MAYKISKGLAYIITLYTITYLTGTDHASFRLGFMIEYKMVYNVYNMTVFATGN